ncbi:MAG: sugar-specific transcriptional regulator TrmB [Candidatus Azotimanducaceae bacterium]|jgi:sugar-specific transcriptional regulator TrmB
MSRSQSRTLELLQQLGCTAYEAKAYIACLSCQPATAYEISKASGVPSSKVYETVNKLVARGIIKPLPPEKNNRLEYVALSGDDFLTEIQDIMLSRTKELGPLLKNLNTDEPISYIWPLSSHSQIQDKAKEIIHKANISVLISAWKEEIDWLEAELREAEARGIDIALVHFGVPKIKIGATYHHPIENTIYDEKKGRGLTLVVDNEVVLLAHYGMGSSGIEKYDLEDKVDGAWSRNPSFVTVAEDYVKHDVYITKVTRFLPKEMVERFGPQYEKLRAVFDSEA